MLLSLIGFEIKNGKIEIKNKNAMKVIFIFILLKIRHLHARIAKSMPHTQLKQNVQNAKQKKNAELELSEVLTLRMKVHHVEWNTMLNEALHKRRKTKVEWEKKRLERSHQNQKFIATKSMMVTTCAKIVARTMTRATKTNKQ